MTIDAKIFNTEKTDYKQPSLFMGQQLGLLDTINKNYPEIFRLYKKMKSLDWDENEFDFTACNTEFKTCSKNTYEIMIRTLSWQWEADSVACKSIIPIIAPFVTSTELWAAWGRIADNECLTGDHEVLTPKGWKRIDEVTMDDTVAQWEYSTRAITFVNPQAIIVKPHDGLMYHFYDGNRNVSQITTPNHRMPIVYPYSSFLTSPLCNTAETVHYSGGNALPTAGFISTGGRHMTAQERLYVAVQADGTMCSEKYTGANTGYVYYKFGFSKKRKINRLFELCNAANWRISEIDSKSERAIADGARTFYVYVPVCEYNKLAKTFDWFDLDKISYEWAMDFLDEIKYWDGNVTDKGRTRYISTNKACIDKVVAIAHLVGHRAHVTVIPERISALMPGGSYSNTKQSYQVYICDRPYTVGNAIIKTAIEYTGNVYCLTVPSSYFMVRHSGAVSVTGNCVHGLTYSEMVRNSFDDPDQVLKEILEVSEALQRMDAVADVFSKVYDTSLALASGNIQKDQKAYEDIYMFVVAMYCLERIQFVASFAVTFAVANSGQFVQFGKAVQKICQDEFEVHQLLDRAVLDYEARTEYGKLARINNKQRIETLVTSVIDSELNWVDYLLSDGRELVGMTPELLKGWVLYNAKDVLDYFNIEHGYDIPTKNPIPFIEDWIDINRIQASPQEEKNGQYMLGMVMDDMSDDVIQMEL